jgi:hypothetical protein
MEFARAQWSTRLGVALPDDVPPIEYFDGCLTYPEAYMRPEWDDGCIGGRYVGSVPVIQLRRGPSAGDDALAHELLHWALEVSTGDSDSAHAGPAWPQADEVRDTLTAYAPLIASEDRMSLIDACVDLGCGDGECGAGEDATRCTVDCGCAASAPFSCEGMPIARDCACDPDCEEYGDCCPDVVVACRS